MIQLLQSLGRYFSPPTGPQKTAHVTKSATVLDCLDVPYSARPPVGGRQRQFRLQLSE